MLHTYTHTHIHTQPQRSHTYTFTHTEKREKRRERRERREKRRERREEREERYHHREQVIPKGREDEASTAEGDEGLSVRVKRRKRALRTVLSSLLGAGNCKCDM